jgi:hypothetical protein
LAIAAPEGSVTWPRKLPEAACEGTACAAVACAAASVEHNGKIKSKNAKQRKLRTFIPLFQSAKPNLQK